MRTKCLTTICFAFIMALMLNSMEAQEKTIKIITKDDGDAKVQVFNSSDELDEETKKLLEEKGIDINIIESGDNQSYKIKIVDDNDLIEEMEWNGEGEAPEGMEKHMRIIKSHGEDGEHNVFMIKSEDGDDFEDVEIDINEIIEENGATKKKIKVVVKDDEGELKEMEWNGEGEMPQEMKRYVEDIENGSNGKCLKKIVISDDKHEGLEDLDLFISEMEGADQGGVQLGVMIEKNDKGLKIIDLIEGSGAEKSGLLKGDIIQYLNDKPVSEMMQLIELVNENEVGDEVKLGVLREGKTKDIKVELTEKKTKVFIKKIECEWTDEKECKKVCTEKELAECKKKCSKEDYEKCKKEMKETQTFTAPRNTLNLKSFKAYPNPSDGIVNISFTAKKQPLIVQIVDISGKSLFKDTVNSFDGLYEYQIDLNGKADGSVFLSIIQNEKVFTKQLLVQ